MLHLTLVFRALTLSRFAADATTSVLARARMASQAFRLREMFMQLRLTCEALQSLAEEGAR